jgi:hypothetical protein
MGSIKPASIDPVRMLSISVEGTGCFAVAVSELMASMRLGSGSASDDFRRDVADDVEPIKASRTVTRRR